MSQFTNIANTLSLEVLGKINLCYFQNNVDFFFAYSLLDMKNTQ